MQFQKQARVPRNTCLSMIVGSIIMIISLLVTLNSIPSAIDYIRIRDELVKVEATVTRVDISRVFKGDRHSKIYVSYTYDDEFYGNILLKRSDDTLTDVGDTFTVRIHPSDPGKLQSPKVLLTPVFFGWLAVKCLIALPKTYFSAIKASEQESSLP